MLVEGIRGPIRLPMREAQLEPVPLLGLATGGLDVLDVGDIWAPIELPMGEVLLELV